MLTTGEKRVECSAIQHKCAIPGIVCRIDVAFFFGRGQPKRRRFFWRGHQKRGGLPEQKIEKREQSERTLE